MSSQAALWLARCYPSGQIPRTSAILRGCARHLIADLNHEPLSLDTTTGNLATLTTRPLRRRLIMVFRSVIKWPRPPWKRTGKKRCGSGIRTHNLEDGRRTRLPFSHGASLGRDINISNNDTWFFLGWYQVSSSHIFCGSRRDCAGAA